MRKLPRAGRWADVLHRAFVWTCIGVTVFATANVGFRVYHYYSVVKPQMVEEEKHRQAVEESQTLETEFPDIAETLKV